MDADAEPEHDSKREFLRLVPEDPLCNEGARPSTQDFHQVQRVFGNTAPASLRAAFVDAIGNKRDEAQEGHGCQVDDRKVFHDYWNPGIAMRAVGAGTARCLIAADRFDFGKGQARCQARGVCIIRFASLGEGANCRELDRHFSPSSAGVRRSRFSAMHARSAGIEFVAVP